MIRDLHLLILYAIIIFLLSVYFGCAVEEHTLKTQAQNGYILIEDEFYKVVKVK